MIRGFFNFSISFMRIYESFGFMVFVALLSIWLSGKSYVLFQELNNNGDFCCWYWIYLETVAISVVLLGFRFFVKNGDHIMEFGSMRDHGISVVVITVLLCGEWMVWNVLYQLRIKLFQKHDLYRFKQSFWQEGVIRIVIINETVRLQRSDIWVWRYCLSVIPQVHGVRLIWQGKDVTMEFGKKYVLPNPKLISPLYSNCYQGVNSIFISFYVMILVGWLSGQFDQVNEIYFGVVKISLYIFIYKAWWRAKTDAIGAFLIVYEQEC